MGRKSVSERITIIESLPKDIHVHAVIWAMKRKGQHAVPLFASNFPSKSEFTIGVGRRGEWTAKYSGPESSFTVDETSRGVYVSRRGAPPLPDPTTHKHDVAAAGMENTAALNALRDVIAAAPGIVPVNSISAKRLADRKPLQLIVAAQCGFHVPESRFTNSWDETQRFAKSQGRPLAYKSYTPVSWRSLKDGALTTSMSYTSLVSAAELSDKAAVRRTSGIYQEYLPKTFEVRTVVMGSTFFSSRLDSQANEPGVIDWRRGQDTLASSHIPTPEDIKNKCINYMKRLGLLFGCFDFIVEDTGRWIFLECNEQGQWLWQEAADPTMQLLDAYAEFLISPTENFEYTPSKDICTFSEYERTSWHADSVRSYEDNVTFESGWVTLEASA